MPEPASRRSVRQLASFALCLAACTAKPSGSLGTADVEIARAMQQSRSGAWTDGIGTTRAVLARADLTFHQRAEALCLLAGCCRRTGDGRGAEEAIAAFDAIATAIPPGSWTLREIERDRCGQTELPTPPAGSATTMSGSRKRTRFADVPTEVWNVRHRNSTGQYKAAAELARTLLDSGEVQMPEQRCDLLMHRAFAMRELGCTEEADREFKAFGTEAKALPHTSRLRDEMALLRASLGLVPAPGLEARGEFRPPALDAYWRMAPPADVGIEGETVRDLAAAARVSGADGLLVARRGVIVLEWYSPLYDEPMRTMSSCKSITGLLTGMLIERRKLSLDDRVGDAFPAWRTGLRNDVTVRHLLTMTSGLPNRPTRSAKLGEGWTAFALHLEPARLPGTTWEYSNEGVQLLSPLLERAAGRPLHEFAREELFTPIGAVSTTMRTDDHGSTNTFADAATTLREFARFGELVRLRGRWPGAGQIVSEEWIDAMTTPCPQSKEYGYLWWLGENPRTLCMRGYLDTNLWVVPELDLVVARVQSRAYLHATQPFNERAMLDALRRGCR